MNNIKLVEVGKANIKKEWELLSALENENGFENSCFNCSFDEYKNNILPSLIKMSKGIDLKPNFVPQTNFILYADNIGVGVFKIRHYCNEITRSNGVGHIGYAIKKEYRGLGYAKAGLALAIKELIKMPDYDKRDGVIMGFHKDNIASFKVQQSCGAVIIGETKEDYITKIEVK